MKNVDRIIPKQKDGESVPIPNPLDEQRWGKATLVLKGHKIANTPLREARLFYPAICSYDGTPLSVASVSEIIERLLQQSGASTDRPHSTRHTIASIALNDWGMSVKDVCQLFHWETEDLVWSRYARQKDEAVHVKADAASEAEFALPEQTGQVVRETVDSVIEFLQQHRSGAGHELVPVWSGLFAALDTLAGLERGAIRPGEALHLTPAERAEVDAFIAQKTDRHDSIESLIGRRLTIGLRPPRPNREPDGDEALPEGDPDEDHLEEMEGDAA